MSANAEHPLTTQLRERLSATLSPTQLVITDQSHLHAGHAGAEGGARHYHARVVAACFRGKTRVQQHRLVYDTLADLMPNPIHALALETGVPAE
jgi:BolA protein